MTLVQNNDTATRRWDWLKDNGTGRTLYLRAGQMADVDLPEGFSDPYLAPVAPLVSDAAPMPPEPPVPESPAEPPAPPDPSIADPSAPAEE